MSIFYQLYLKEGIKALSRITPGEPLGIWISSLPGSSAQLGNFDQIGPILLSPQDEKYSLRKNPNSWNQLMHLLFIDVPENTGFTSGNTNYTTSDQVALSLFKVLDDFPEFVESNIYILGEGYAGHTAASLAKLFIDSPAKSKYLKGIALQNAWIAPFVQIGYYGSFLYSIGYVDNGKGDKIIYNSTQMQSSILNKKYDKASTDLIMQFQLFHDASFVHLTSNISKAITRFMNDNQIAFNTNTVFKAYNNDILTNYINEYTKDFSMKWVEILQAKVKVLLFNGQLNLSVNQAGFQMWINQLKWNDIIDWRKHMTKETFTAPSQDGQPTGIAGTIQTLNNFRVATIYRSSDEPTKDNPTACFQLISDFIQL